MERESCVLTCDDRLPKSLRYKGRNKRRKNGIQGTFKHTRSPNPPLYMYH